MMQGDWKTILLRLSVVLAGLLILLSGLTVLYIIILVLQRFGGIVALFVVGAIFAYVLNPGVNRVAAKVGKRSAAIAIVYVGVAICTAIVGVLVFQPLASQSSALVTALKSPSARSLTVLNRIAAEATTIGTELRGQKNAVGAGQTIPPSGKRQVEVEIAGLQREMAALEAPAPSANQHRAAGRHALLATQLHIPPTYLRPLHSAISTLAADYRPALLNRKSAALAALNRSISDAGTVVREANTLHHTVASTPILLLDAQTWADQHHIKVDVPASAGHALKAVTGQTASLLSDTASVLTQTATVLLDLSLSLIISVYVVSDGDRVIEETIKLVPGAYRARVRHFVTSVDDILSSYIRGQLLLALLAGVLAGIGAAVLGVPFPVVIGVGTFLLWLIPVIGTTLVYIPPVIIALLFTSVRTTLMLVAYIFLFEQVVSNVIGPHVTGKSAGISALEAMAAALIGYSIGGILGAFLAVPVVGVLHVVVKEARDAWNARGAKSPATDDEAKTSDEPPAESQSTQLTISSAGTTHGRTA